APPPSTSVSDALATFTYNLADGETYTLVANGIVSPSGYSPVQPFDIYVYAGSREVATSGASNTDILVFHGATDAPVVDVAETAVLAGATLVDDLAYGEFDGYLEVPTNDYVLEVQLSDGTPVVAYQAPLSTLNLDGAALTVVASGFLTPANNSNGAPFGLWVALPAGGDLVELPLATAVVENSLIANAIAWPNPANDVLNVSIDSKRLAQADLRLTDMTGRTVRTIPATTLAIGNNRMSVDLNGLAEGLYQLSIAGNGAISTLPVQVVR
ncbi:MAG: T9SS type A sorting domain-containing protein, partial [Flavobacteriales bacterium]|nr:T9SS type A sorting domain-containing protein [Flavobacteriales bacterium]